VAPERHTRGSARTTAHAKQIAANIAHPVETVTVLPRPRQRVGGGLFADERSVPRNQRPPQPRLNRLEHHGEGFLVHH
jgi:hypothetical protein